MGEEFDTDEKNICGIMWTLKEGKSRIALWVTYPDAESAPSKELRKSFKKCLGDKGTKVLGCRSHKASADHAKQSGASDRKGGKKGGSSSGPKTTQPEKEDGQAKMYESAAEYAAKAAQSSEEEKK